MKPTFTNTLKTLMLGGAFALAANQTSQAAALPEAPAGASPVDGIVTYDDASLTATFTPIANLAVGTAYTATITTGMKDSARPVALPAHGLARVEARLPGDRLAGTVLRSDLHRRLIRLEGGSK